LANDQGTYLSYLNWVEDAGASFDTSVDVLGDRDFDNVATTLSDDFWRIGATSGAGTIDFGQDRSVQVVSIQFPRFEYTNVSEDNPNFASSDTIQVELLDVGDSVLYDSTALASGVEVGYMIYTLKLNSPVTARKLRVTFSAPSRTTQGFFDVGNIWAGPIIEPNVGFIYPASYGWMPQRDSSTTPAGRLYTSRFEPLRRWNVTFDALGNTEAMTLDEVVRYSALSRQLLFRRGDLPSGKDSMLCVISNARDIDSITAEIRRLSLRLEEFI